MANNNYFIYKTKPGDFLTTLAKKFNISPKDLINYHNKNCKNYFKIYFDNLLGIPEIYIPINYKTSKEIEEQLLSERPSVLIKPTFYKEKYKVVETVKTEPKDSIEISYNLVIESARKTNKQYISIAREPIRATRRNYPIKCKNWHHGVFRVYFLFLFCSMRKATLLS